MKKGISLIETLISLTIVGLSLVALLPVMTIKKSAYSTSAGNSYFEHVTSAGENYYRPTRPLIIGNPTDVADDIPIANRNFEIYTPGLANSSIVPIYASESLLLNNAIVKPFVTGVDPDRLQIVSGPMPAAGASITYPMNIYLDTNSVAIGTHDNFNVENNRNDTWRWDKEGWLDNDRNPIPDTADPTKHHPPLNMLQNNLTSISSGTNEFIHISHPNIGGNPYHIGVGQNVVGKSNLNFASLNFVGIFNAGADGFQQQTLKPEVDFALGYTGLASPAPFQPDNYVLSHATVEGTSRFTLNATTIGSTDATPRTFTAGRLILPSDKRLKTILSDYKRGLKEILNIKPVEFVFKSDTEQKHHIGIIAQDLKKVIPEAVSVNKTTGYYMVSDEPVFFALINAIKDIYDKYLTLKKNNDELENKIVELRKIRDSLKASQGGADE